MKYILEGPDGAGKSTLAEKLGSVWHHSYYPDRREMFIKTAESLISDAVSIDRLYYSELVYSPIYHKTPQRYGPGQMRMLDRLIWTIGRRIIFCMPSYETCHKAWSSGREEMVSDEEQFKAIYDAYDKLTFNTPAVKYNWEVETFDELMEKVNDLQMSENKGPGIGHFKKGNILIVGDQASNPMLGPDLPFVHYEGCSPWFTTQLEYAGVNEKDLYFVNGKTINSFMTDPKFLEELEPSHIVALGDEAAKWCEVVDVAHKRFEHPSYWKRFRHHDLYPLVNFLRSVNDE